LFNDNYFQFNDQSELLAAYGIRPSTRHTEEQRKALTDLYALTKYPTKEQKNALSTAIGISEYQVSVWFMHQRKKDKTK
jgi:hypothetical protein